MEFESSQAKQAAVSKLNESNLANSLKQMFEVALREQSTPARKKLNSGLSPEKELPLEKKVQNLKATLGFSNG